MGNLILGRQLDPPRCLHSDRSSIPFLTIYLSLRHTPKSEAGAHEHLGRKGSAPLGPQEKFMLGIARVGCVPSKSRFIPLQSAHHTQSYPLLQESLRCIPEFLLGSLSTILTQVRSFSMCPTHHIIISTHPNYFTNTNQLLVFILYSTHRSKVIHLYHPFSLSLSFHTSVGIKRRVTLSASFTESKICSLIGAEFANFRSGINIGSMGTRLGVDVSPFILFKALM